MSSNSREHSADDSNADHDASSVKRSVHKKHSEHHDEEEGEPWLLSFADLVTLLMCFFILFFSVDKSKGAISDPQRLKEKLESSIGMDAEVMEPPAPPQTSASDSSDSQEKSKNSGGTETSKEEKEKEQQAERFARQMQTFAKQLKVVFGLSSNHSGYLELTFLSLNFFQPGSAELTRSGNEILSKTIPKLRSLSADTQIEIEGHTDSDQMRSSRFKSNLELSLVRAAAVAHYLEGNGISPKQIKVSGFGPNRPLLPERNELGFVNFSAKKLNRRVVIRISQLKVPNRDKSKNNLKPDKN